MGTRCTRRPIPHHADAKESTKGKAQAASDETRETSNGIQDAETQGSEAKEGLLRSGPIILCVLCVLCGRKPKRRLLGHRGHRDHRETTEEPQGCFGPQCIGRPRDPGRYEERLSLCRVSAKRGGPVRRASTVSAGTPSCAKRAVPSGGERGAIQRSARPRRL